MDNSDLDYISPGVVTTDGQSTKDEPIQQQQQHSVFQHEWVTTRRELWSFYLYYVGNSGFSGLNFGPSQFQNLLSLAGYDPAVPGKKEPCGDGGCVINFLGKDRDVESAALLANGLSFMFQAVLLLTIGAWADYGTWRPNINIFFTLLGVGVAFGWLGVDQPSQISSALTLYILGLIAYQLSLTFWTAAFPGLARNLPEVRASATQVTEGLKDQEEHANFESLQRNRISNVSFLVCSIGTLPVLGIMIGIIKAMRAEDSVENNTKTFNALIAFTGAVWLVCALPWFFTEKRRPGLAIPSSKSFLTIGFRQTYVAFRECLRLKQTFLYLIFYFLMGDVLNTTQTLIWTIQYSVVSYSTYQLTLILILGIFMQWLGIHAFWLVQKRYNISTKAMLSFTVIWIFGLVIWGMAGLWTDKVGYKHVWEIWRPFFRLYSAYYSFFVCPWYAYSQTMISEVSPHQQMFLFFALFSVIGKSSSCIGPFVSSAIIDASGGNKNMPFVFFLALGAVSIIFLYMIDIQKSRKECEDFVSAESKREAFA